jgi:hypothetical protein
MIVLNFIWNFLGSITTLFGIVYGIYSFGRTIQKNEDNINLVEKERQYQNELNNINKLNNELVNKHTLEILELKIRLSKYENVSTYKRKRSIPTQPTLQIAKN